MKKISLLFTMLSLTLVIFAQGLSVGDNAPDFTLKNVDGDLITLSEYDDASKGAIVIFTCNHCPYAIAYEDRIMAIDNMFRSEGYPVIAINPNDPELQPKDSYDEMVIRSKEKKFPFPYLFDEEQTVYKKYGATRTPHVYLLTKETDKFKVAYIGTIDDNYKDESAVEKKYLVNAVKSALAGNTPDPSFTKAIGCSIKDKSTKR